MPRKVGGGESICSKFVIIHRTDGVKFVVFIRAGDAVNEDTVNDLESDKNCEEILSESLIEISGLSAAEGTDTDVKKARSRKTKFK